MNKRESASRNRADRASLSRFIDDGIRRRWPPAESRHPPPLSQPPPHLAMREQRPRPRCLLHANPLGRSLELVLALVRTEEVAALLVFAARRCVASLDEDAADWIVRPVLGPAVARIHVRPPLPLPKPTSCKRDAAPVRPVKRVTVREALPRVGSPVDSPGGHRADRGGAPGDARSALSQHLRGPGARRLDRRRSLLRPSEGGLRAEKETGAEEQGAGGLAGEEEPSHARHNLQRYGQIAAEARSPACSQGLANRVNRSAPRRHDAWPNSSAS